MSGLAAVLADRKPPGVYRWTSGLEVAGVGHAVEKAGWRFAFVDTCRTDDQDGFLAEVARVLGSGGTEPVTGPGALAALLGGVHADHGTVVLWEGWSPFARADRQAFERVVDALRERSGTTRGGAFAALLRGDGPEIGIAELDPHSHPA
ncbi:MAG: hypothetical protein GEU93_14390 [Propionibacteriales bacterium]|nr:hypothetical protein [Propionibacteriales bacterium]